MQAAVAQPYIEYCGVRLTPKSLHEVQGSGIANVAPCDSVNDVVAAYGLRSPHPLLQIGMGLLLIFVSLILTPYLLNLFGEFGVHLAAIWLVPSAVIGLALISTAFRRGYYLEVRSAAGVKRLAFRRGATPAGLKSLVDALGIALGVKVRMRNWLV